ncbi:probable pectinesterase/pectinesterase inhibitor 7 isoform X1 [Fagus crenata]
MASNLFSPITFSFFILLPFIFATLSFADNYTNLTSPVSPTTICKSTQDPSYCKSVLPNQNANVYDYCRFVVQKSLSQARKFSNIVDTYLQRSSTLSETTIRALLDCQFLAGLNVDFLKTSYKNVNITNVALSSLVVYDIQTLLSAVLTNQQTCLDGLETTASDANVKNDLSGPLSDDTKLHGVSLALFNKGWVPMKKNDSRPKRNHPSFRNGRFPFKMSGHTRTIYESVSRRKLLQAAPDQEVTVYDIVTVSQDGSGNFTTINAAIASAPNNTNSSAGYFLIYIRAGFYQEYVSIAKNKNNLLMIGDGINQTIITGNRSVVDGSTTFNSATFAVVAPGFVAVNITFRNTAGAIKGQAVALRSGADMSTFYSCSFEGYQDTLYTHSLRQFYRECDIYGTVDFIFGNAAVVFQNCNIYPRLPISGQFNSITAQGRTDPNQNTGTSIQNSTIRAASDLAANNGTTQTYLGRPWKSYSLTVFMQSFIDSFINPAGWHEWSGSTGLSTLYYAEYNNTGPGSNTTNRVTWPGYHVINATVAVNFTVSNFILGDYWLPQTGVPYTGGLI